MGTSKKVQAMLPEDAVRAMSRVSGVSLSKASLKIGRCSQNISATLREAEATRRRGTNLPCGPKAETLALVARAMGFRLALVGHGTVIEVLPGRGLCDD